MTNTNERAKIERLEALAETVKEFFKLLDTVEISSNDREFHPISISCCRNAMMEPLDCVLKSMKELSHNE